MHNMCVMVTKSNDQQYKFINIQYMARVLQMICTVKSAIQINKSSWTTNYTWFP